MRTLTCLALALAVALAACGSKNATGMTGDVNKDASAFMVAFANAVIAGGDDCDKIAANIEALEPQAKALHEELEAAKKKLSDLPPDPSVKVPAFKDPDILDKCEKSSPRANKALDQTLLVVAPL